MCRNANATSPPRDHFAGGLCRHLLVADEPRGRRARNCSSAQTGDRDEEQQPAARPGIAAGRDHVFVVTGHDSKGSRRDMTIGNGTSPCQLSPMVSARLPASPPVRAEAPRHRQAR